MAKKMKPMKLSAGERCAVLNDDGRQCRNIAVAVSRIHTDDELYGYFSRPYLPWVRVPTCDKHKESR